MSTRPVFLSKSVQRGLDAAASDTFAANATLAPKLAKLPQRFLHKLGFQVHSGDVGSMGGQFQRNGTGQFRGPHR